MDVDENMINNNDDLEDSPTEDQFISNFARLKETTNPDNRFDLTTKFGQYTMIYTVLKNFTSKAQLKRLIEGPEQRLENDEAMRNEEDQVWRAEVEALMDPTTRVLNLESSTPEEIQYAASLEQLRDNSAYQPGDYIEACTALKVDSELPLFLCMNPAQPFKPWQVTGIHGLYQIFNSKLAKAALLADATGLGKTLQVLEFWEMVFSLC